MMQKALTFFQWLITALVVGFIGEVGKDIYVYFSKISVYKFVSEFLSGINSYVIFREFVINNGMFYSSIIIIFLARIFIIKENKIITFIRESHTNIIQDFFVSAVIQMFAITFLSLNFFGWEYFALWMLGNKIAVQIVLGVVVIFSLFALLAFELAEEPKRAESMLTKDDAVSPSSPSSGIRELESKSVWGSPKKTK